MKKRVLLKNRVLAICLTTALIFGCLPTYAVSANSQKNTQITTQSKNDGVDIEFTLGSKASYVDNGNNGQAIKIGASWVENSGGMAASAAFSDGNILKKDAFTLYTDVYRQVISTDNNAQDGTNQGKSVAFCVGEEKNYFKICLSNGGSLRYVSNGESEKIAAFTATTKENKWNALAVSYEEIDGMGTVTVYVEGKKVLEQTNIGFALSKLTDIKANIGGGFATGFMGKGLYNNLVIEDTVIHTDSIEIADRYTPYTTFSGAADGILCSGNVNVNEWLDTNGEHIQAHGGQVQWLDTLDLDENGTAEGGWIWYGEDKTRNGKPIDGIHCYTSSDLYNWTDRGIVLSTHDIVPDELTADKSWYQTNSKGLENLKVWAEMDESTEEVSSEMIDMAKAFIGAYKTEAGYDEENLERAFKYLYSGYCIAERPKMLYNESTKQYVIVYHVDAPADERIMSYLKGETNAPSRYGRACMGFAVSDTPYGPFKLVNVQRMNYRTGGDYATNTGMARDMTVFMDDTDVNKDGVKDAYAIYSSEDNEYMYISLLNSTYTAPITEGAEDTLKLADGTKIQTFADRVLGSDTWREAPALFKYNGYYYMITSGCTGWIANAAGYYRSESIYGPWTSLGDPCEGGSGNTFGSQPTAVIPVDPERGKFIYMGDRWSYTVLDASAGSNGTDSAHWDSGYVWLPIEIKEDNTIMLPNISNWDLSVLDKPKVNTEIPELISSIDDLPTQLNVTYDAGTFDSTVVWNVDNLEYFTTNRISGTLTDLDNRTISINVKAAPKNIVYLVDAGAGSVEERNNYIASDNTVLKNKTAADQAYSVVNKWGHVGNNTTARTLTSGNIYEMLRYVSSSDNRNLLYQFDELEEGNYSVYVGLHEPSGWYSSTRIANISVKQGETVLAKSEENYGKKGDAGRYVVYENLELQGTDSVQVVLNPKNTGSNTDVQISFIAIVDNTIRKGDGDQNGGNGDNNNGDQNGGNGDNNNGNQNGGNGDSNNGNQNGGNEDNNNGNQNGESEQKIPASSITLNTKKLYIVKGKNIQLKAMMMPANTTDTLIWSSSKESVATVSDGKIKAKKVGNTKVTVTTTSGKKVTCKVYVVKKAKKSVSVKLNKKKLTMKTGSISILTATLKPAKSTDTIKWKSSNKKVASVDKYGYITAKKKGKATITATTKSGKKAKCIINVK